MVSKPRSLKRFMPVLGVALVAALALSVGVASASASYWYVGGSKLATGTPTNTVTKGTAAYKLKWKIGSILFEVNCSSQSDEGTIENPTGGAPGTRQSTGFALSGCTVPLPLGQGCKIPNGTIHTAWLSATATESSKVQFKPATGTEILVIQLQGCSTETLNTTYPVQGSITGLSNALTSSLEFTSTSSSMTLGGVPVTFTGISHIETVTGKTVTAAP